MFSPSSRYAQIPQATYETPDGTAVTYLRRRFPPASQSGHFGHTHVQPEERVDQLTARTLRDPLQFWRLCDSNGVMDPFELVESAGRRVRIPLTFVPEPE